jgi:hypothetical protein
MGLHSTHTVDFFYLNGPDDTTAGVISGPDFQGIEAGSSDGHM